MKVELSFDNYVLSTVILNADCFSRGEGIADQSDRANDENNELDDEEASDWGRSDENLLDLYNFLLAILTSLMTVMFSKSE